MIQTTPDKTNIEPAAVILPIFMEHVRVKVAGESSP